MKKLLTVLMVAVLAFGLVGCTDDGSETTLSGGKTLMINVTDSVSGEAIEGATVKINGQKKGQKVELAPGEYKVTVEKKNYVNDSKTVTVKEDETNTTTFKLDPYATLVLNPVDADANEDLELGKINPEDKTVQLKDKATLTLGKTTLDKIEDIEGANGYTYNVDTKDFEFKVDPTETWRVKTSKYLYNSVTKDIDVEPGQKKTVTLEVPRAKTAEVTVNAETPSGDAITDKKVYVNEVYTGKKTDSNGAATVKVPAGEDTKLRVEDVVQTKSVNYAYGSTNIITLLDITFHTATVNENKAVGGGDEWGQELGKLKYAIASGNLYLKITWSEKGSANPFMLLLDNPNNTTGYQPADGEKNTTGSVTYDMRIDYQEDASNFDLDAVIAGAVNDDGSWNSGASDIAMHRVTGSTKSDYTDISSDITLMGDLTFVVPFSAIGVDTSNVDQLNAVVLYGKGSSDDGASWAGAHSILPYTGDETYNNGYEAMLDTAKIDLTK